MPPPELAGDAPVPDILHPVQVDAGKAGRHENGALLLDRGDGRPGQRLHLHEPLARHQRLHNAVAALAAPDGVQVRLDLLHQAQGSQLLHHPAAAFQAVQAGKPARGRGHLPILADHLDYFQVVAPPDFEVVRVMTGSDLYRPGAEGRIHIPVRYHRDLPIHQGQDHRPPHQGPVTRILRMHRYGRVSEHGLRAGGRHHDPALTPGQGIADKSKGGFRLGMLDLNVGQCGMAAGAPVDQVVPAIDQPPLEQVHENLAHRPGTPFVQGEALPGPVYRNPQPLQLLGDAGVVLIFPFPYLGHKPLPAQVVAGQPLRGQVFLHPDLGGNPGVITAGQPQGIVALHAAPASENVLNGIVQGMSHMQRTGDIGGRNDNGVRFRTIFTAGGEPPPIEPETIAPVFHLLRLVDRRQGCLAHTFTSSLIHLR